MIFVFKKLQNIPAKEPMMRIELMTPSLPRKCSTSELHRQRNRAEDEARTRDPNLGRVMLYQLSYFRKIPVDKPEWGGEDSNLRSRQTTDLQSAPFDRSGTSPEYLFSEPMEGFEPPTS